MSRSLRIQYPGALYHITSRGNRKKDIFTSEYDRGIFLSLLRHTIKKHNLLLHAYCLMKNHYHLLLETVDPNLSDSMRELNGRYAQTYNKTHGTVGHLFQGRYKAFVIEKESYLLKVARYIVLNPVRAKFAKHPRDWEWSSYRQTAGLICASDFLYPDLLLGMFAQSVNIAQDEYISFVTSGIDARSPFQDSQGGIILGSTRFAAELWCEDLEHIKEIVCNERMVARPSLSDIFEHTFIKEDRDKAIYQARLRAGYSITEIARFLYLHRTTVSGIFNKMFKTLQSTARPPVGR